MKTIIIDGIEYNLTPKALFKKGDWVRAISSGNIFKILSVNDGLYRVLCYDGVEANCPITDIEKDLAYWTIQDAKDGDVLVDKYGNVVIYQELSTNLLYHSYCYGYKTHFIDAGGSHFISNTYPATKEQRDLLFQKMKEAGYEWDIEKKELKKIEQKPAWSEEDEKQARQIERIVHDSGCTRRLQKQIANWLKSLKERYTWKPSDYQLEALDSATENCAYSEYQDCLRDLIKQLKKLMEG